MVTIKCEICREDTDLDQLIQETETDSLVCNICWELKTG